MSETRKYKIRIPKANRVRLGIDNRVAILQRIKSEDKIKKVRLKAVYKDAVSNWTVSRRLLSSADGVAKRFRIRTRACD